jgi:predicted GIY-YIG superfamily endonuclease
MYYVYILKSERDSSKYIGVTKDLKRRLKEHNSGFVRYTSSKMTFKPIWYCVFKNKEKAYKFEKYLKSSSGYAFTNKRLILQ